MGYELTGDIIIELLSDGILLLTDLNNQRKHLFKPIKRVNDLIKDRYGRLYATTDRSAYRISITDAKIYLDSVAVELEKLKWHMQYCDDVSDTSFFLRRYKDFNQTTAFFAISGLNAGHQKMLKEITDEQRKNAVTSFAAEYMALNQYLESRGINRMTATNPNELKLVNNAFRSASMLEKNYALPSYSFLRLVNDSIYLFAHDIDSMFVYDQSWDLIRSRRINYHHLKTWGKELLVDEEKTRVFAKFNEGVRPVIAEIDLRSGALKAPSTTINALFPQRIMVRHNVVYFMARQKGGPGYTLFAQSLNH